MNAIVAEAMTWIGTPYQHMARVKGGGVDCAQILIAVYSAVGLVPAIDVGWYAHDWHMHRSIERYMLHLMRYADEIEMPMAGDVVLMKFGRCFSHGGIVVDEHRFVHSYVGRGVELAEFAEFGLRDRRFFRVRS